MATKVRKTDPSLADVADAFNALKADYTAKMRALNVDLVSIASNAADFATPTVLNPGFHNDVSEKTVTVADATNLATSLKLVNHLTAVYKFHMDDTLAHKIQGVALASYAPVKSLATAIVRANDIKSKFNTHRASTTYHYSADTTNDVTASNATSTQNELDTLLNDIKVQMLAHMASGPVAKSLRLVDA